MARTQITASIGGKTIVGSTTLDAPDAPTEVGTEVAIPAGKAGTLSTRTDNNTGVLTLSVSHGITDGQIVDVFWSGGIRRGMTVGTVAGTSVPIDGGTGDNLPIATTAIVACVVQTVDLDILGNSVEMAAVSVSTGCRGSIEFQQEDGTAIKSLDLTATSTEPAIWNQTPADTNPFAGVSIGKVKISNGVSSGACTIIFGLARENVS